MGGTVKAGQWMQIDMGEVLTVAGTIVQNRKDYPGQHVKTYTVKTSLDGKNFEAVSGGAYEGKKGTAKNLFHSGGRRKARYVRFTVQTWDAKQHPSMRADVLVVEKKGPSAGISTRAIAATGGGVTCGNCPAGYANDGAKGCKGSFTRATKFDGYKCPENHKNRVFKALHKTPKQCAALCEKNAQCKYFSTGSPSQYCIGCKVAPATKHPGATSYVMS